MFVVYDLYDIHSVLIWMRENPNSPINSKIIESIMNVLINCIDENENNDSINIVRKALRTVDEIRDIEYLKFVFADNKYTYYPNGFLKDKRIYKILLTAFEEFSKTIPEGNEARIYDLADCLHDLPIIIAANNYSIPKRFWTIHVKYYRKKWNKDFLTLEQKTLKL